MRRAVEGGVVCLVSIGPAARRLLPPQGTKEGLNPHGEDNRAIETDRQASPARGWNFCWKMACTCLNSKEDLDMPAETVEEGKGKVV